MQVENYTELLSAVVKSTKDLTKNQDLIDRATAIQLGYTILFDKFYKVYSVYSTSEKLSTSQIDQLGRWWKILY